MLQLSAMWASLSDAKLFSPLEKQLTDETRSLIQEMDIQGMDLSQIIYSSHLFKCQWVGSTVLRSCPNTRFEDARSPNCAPFLFWWKTDISLSVLLFGKMDAFLGTFSFFETGSVMKGYLSHTYGPKIFSPVVRNSSITPSYSFLAASIRQGSAQTWLLGEKQKWQGDQPKRDENILNPVNREAQQNTVVYPWMPVEHILYQTYSISDKKQWSHSKQETVPFLISSHTESI